MIVNHKPNINWYQGKIDWGLPKNMNTITLLCVGDILMEGTYLSIIENVINKKNINFPLLKIKKIFSSADIIFGNLENPISDRGEPILKYGPNFRAASKMVVPVSITTSWPSIDSLTSFMTCTS